MHGLHSIKCNSFRVWKTWNHVPKECSGNEEGWHEFSYIIYLLVLIKLFMNMIKIMEGGGSVMSWTMHSDNLSYSFNHLRVFIWLFNYLKCLNICSYFFFFQSSSFFLMSCRINAQEMKLIPCGSNFLLFWSAFEWFLTR